VTRDNTVYLISLDSVLDRELTPFFNMRVTAVDSGVPPLQSEKSFRIVVDDLNDNSPYFQQNIYYADIQEVVPPESYDIQLTAIDPEARDNALVKYSISNTPQTNSNWFQIDSRSGLITTKMRVDCETQSEPRLLVVATDSGDPPLSGTTTVIIRIRDVNDNQPIFDQSFYNVSVLENMANGSCVLTVSISFSSHHYIMI
jgi:protocadherin-16/23